MATIKGQNLRILLGPDTSHLQCVAAAQSCTVHVSAVVGDSSSKDSEGDWEVKEVTGLQWDAETTALVYADADSGARDLSELTIGQTYYLRFAHTAQTANSKNRNPINTDASYYGKAILTDLQINAQDRQEVTYTAKFIGDGDLAEWE